MNRNSWQLCVLMESKGPRKAIPPSAMCPLLNAIHLRGHEIRLVDYKQQFFFNWNRTENIKDITESADSMIYTSLICVCR